VIVVDTSIWIEFLEGRGTSFDHHVAELIRADAPIALTEVIYCEVLQGIRDDDTHVQIREILQAFPILLMEGLRTADRAVALYRACRKRGFTVRSTVDCLIAAVCLESGAELYQNDRDFDVLAKVHGLKLYRPPTVGR
jgi:predicted nucleic acid-binding protein